jgi:hypothetical protein
MATYEVIVTREDNLWVADVRGLPHGVVGVAAWGVRSGHGPSNAAGTTAMPSGRR